MMESDLAAERHAPNIDIACQAKYTVVYTKTDIFNFKWTMALLTSLRINRERESESAMRGVFLSLPLSLSLSLCLW